MGPESASDDRQPQIGQNGEQQKTGKMKRKKLA
jgi:hypothetical protein